MSIGLETETETTEEIRIKPIEIENNVRFLLSKPDYPVERVLDLERMIAEIDPNRS